MEYNPLAVSLNQDLAGTAALSALSARGKAIYFPSAGILGQSAEAKNASINATIGTAFEEDGAPLTLASVEASFHLPKSSFLYASSYGNPKLRDVWEAQIRHKNPGLTAPFSKPVVTAALTHALSVAGHLFVDPGDKILLPDLFWDNYELLFKESYQATIQTFNTFKDGAFDTAALQAALQKGEKGEKRIVLLNFPNNPTGYTATEREAAEIVKILTDCAEAGNPVVALLDDAYFGLVYEEGVCRESLFAKLAGAHPNLLAVKLDGPTKEDYVWSFRVGFISFAFQGASEKQLAALEKKAAGAVRASISNAPGTSQEALLRAYQSSAYAEEKAEKFAVLQKRYHKIREILAAHPEYLESYEPMPFNSGYFMCVKPKGVEAEAVRKELLKDGIGVIVLSGLVRLAFSSVPLAKLEALFAGIDTAVRRLK